MGVRDDVIKCTTYLSKLGACGILTHGRESYKQAERKTNG